MKGSRPIAGYTQIGAYWSVIGTKVEAKAAESNKPGDVAISGGCE